MNATTLGGWSVRLCAGPEECVWPESVVGEPLDEEERLVDGVHRPAHVVVALREVADEEAAVRGPCNEDTFIVWIALKMWRPSTG